MADTKPMPPQITPPPTIEGLPESPSGVHRAFRVIADDVAKSRKVRVKVYSLGGLLLSGLLVGGGKIVMARGETIETKQGRLEERQITTARDVATLTTRIDAGEKAQQHQALKLERVEALLELELDVHGVPRSKRPARVEDAPNP